MDTAEIGKRTRQENRRLTWLAVKQNKASYLMIAPFMLFFLVFTIVPVLMSLPMGFTDFNMVQMPKFIGLSNYTTLFLADKVFIQSIRVTLVFALFTGPISYVLCFLLAWLINELHPKLRTIFTLIFYAPSMANVYTVWKLIFLRLSELVPAGSGTNQCTDPVADGRQLCAGCHHRCPDVDQFGCRISGTPCRLPEHRPFPV